MSCKGVSDEMEMCQYVLTNLFGDPIEMHETVCSCSDDGTTTCQTLGEGGGEIGMEGREEEGEGEGEER